MDNVRKHSNCINIPSPQNFIPYLQFKLLYYPHIWNILQATKEASYTMSSCLQEFSYRHQMKGIFMTLKALCNSRTHSRLQLIRYITSAWAARRTKSCLATDRQFLYCSVKCSLPWKRVCFTVAWQRMASLVKLYCHHVTISFDVRHGLLKKIPDARANSRSVMYMYPGERSPA
jgi:hypothetical protein